MDSLLVPEIQNWKPGAASRDIPPTALFLLLSSPRALWLAEQHKTHFLIKVYSTSYPLPQSTMCPEV